MKQNKSKLIQEDYLRSILFGAEDALVSTTGVVVGLSAAIDNKFVLLAAGLITVVVEALSMGAGQYISERTIHEMKGSKHTDSALIGGILMLLSYLFAGMIPLLPLLFFPTGMNGVLALVFGFIGLFTLGLIKGKITRHPVRSAFEILLIGGAATLAGILVGNLLHTFGIQS